MIDLLSCRPKLKSNLRYVMQRFGDEASCVLEDPGTGNYWRVGIAEWCFLKRLDGRVTALQATNSAKSDDGESLSEDQARSTVAWAVQEGLIENLKSSDRATAGNAWTKAINASVFFRLGLGNPQPVLQKLYPLIGFLTHPGLIIAWFLVLVAASLVLIGRWSEFSEATMSVVTPDLWIYYLLIWWGLKLVH